MNHILENCFVTAVLLLVILIPIRLLINNSHLQLIQRNKLELIGLGFISILFTACEKSNTHRYPATEVCQNLILSSNNLHPQDRVYLLYDTRLLLREKIDSLNGRNFNSVFCNGYRKEGTLRLVIRNNKQLIIDTSIRVIKPKKGYKIDVNRAQGRLILTEDPGSIKN
ncbi:hypothetical protein [Mucilaginibacter sp. SP1R1]|uniref:hypothetical protein n=1 Tax=Mucilaginibacter sp. SP1R1 TaxID=2723091 RepID=UPI00160BAB6E|nr:hypothetical protein [Mucilaginibacter sp. SP1R1]MBB6149365.1 hypothetical protein [Mucilaginibacter sp. SP1R1]